MDRIERIDMAWGLMMFWARAIRGQISTTAILLTTLIVLQAPTSAQVSIFPQLVGVWNHLPSGHSIDVRDTGDVWSTGRGLARTSSTIDRGGNFAFEGQNSDGSTWRCIYYVTFLADKLSANWRFVSGEGGNCPDGLYVRLVSPPETRPINDCDRFAASPLDPTRPIGVPGVALGQIDTVKAIRVCQDALAARPNDPRTIFQLGRALAKGDDAASRAEAVRLYRKAADAGHVLAMNNLGSIYRDGLGVAKDNSEAVRWYRKGADAGSTDAMGNLGVMYRDGLGVAKDDAEAVRWFLKGADAGSADAMGNLGVMYRDGLGAAKDDAEAVRWFLKGADAGNEYAKDALKRLQQRDPKELTKSLQQALQKVGCDPGEIDGIWGPAAKSALSNFAKHAKTRTLSDEPSDELVRVVSAHNTRVCPLAGSQPREGLKVAAIPKIEIPNPSSTGPHWLIGRWRGQVRGMIDQRFGNYRTLVVTGVTRDGKISGRWTVEDKGGEGTIFQLSGDRLTLTTTYGNRVSLVRSSSYRLTGSFLNTTSGNRYGVTLTKIGN